VNAGGEMLWNGENGNVGILNQIDHRGEKYFVNITAQRMSAMHCPGSENRNILYGKNGPFFGISVEPASD